MKSLLVIVGSWLFLGQYVIKRSVVMENTLRVMTLNLITLLGSVLLLSFYGSFLYHGMNPLSYAAVLCIFVLSFILTHTERGIKYFDWIKVAVILSLMIFFAMLYAQASNSGYIWTFLLPLMSIFVMELKLGTIFCLLYYAFMVSVEVTAGKYGFEVFARHTCIFLAQVALIATYESYRSMTREMLLRDKRQVEHLSITDHLTKLYNRRHFSDIIAQEFTNAANNNESLCFLMVDADHFKQYNDTYGHPQGDAMLIAIANILKTSVRRPNDLVFRMGGEEFGILLPNTKYDWAISLAEKLRHQIQEMKVPLLDGGGHTQITISVGVGILPQSGDGPEVLLKKADGNLYQAKKLGRNRVVG